MDKMVISGLGDAIRGLVSRSSVSSTISPAKSLLSVNGATFQTSGERYWRHKMMRWYSAPLKSTATMKELF